VLKKGWIRNLGEIKDLDFAHDVNGARDYINNKVNETTKGKIDNLIQTTGGSINLSKIFISGQNFYF